MTWFRRKKPIIVGFSYQNLKFYHKCKKPISTDDAINPHILVPGKSGMGKSVLDYALWTRDMDDGNATAEVDTHGNLIKKCIRYLIHKGVDPKDVVISDPTYKPEELGVVQLGLLEVKPGERPYEAADAVVSDFKATYGQGLMDRGLDILRNCCLTAQEAGLAITEIPKCLPQPSEAGKPPPPLLRGLIESPSRGDSSPEPSREPALPAQDLLRRGP